MNKEPSTLNSSTASHPASLCFLALGLSVSLWEGEPLPQHWLSTVVQGTEFLKPDMCSISATCVAERRKY